MKTATCMNAGYAWPNSVFGTTGYCDGQGEDTLALEVQCMDIGVKSTAGVQSLRPEFQPYDAAPTFLNLKDAITPYGNYSYLGDALLISPFYASYGLADNDMGFNHYFDGILTGQPKWKPNALNLFNMDAIDSQTYVGDLIARNDQTWTRMNFISPGVPQAATAVAVGANGDVWAAPAPGGHAIGLFKYNAATGHWASTISAEPNIKRLAVAPDGGVYVVDGSYGTGSNLGHLYHFDKNGNNKTDTGSVVQDVAAGADGSVWAIGVDSSLFHVTGPANAAVTGTPRQTGIRVAVTPIGIPWVLDAAGDIFRYDQPSNTWIQMPGLPATSDSVPVTQVNSSGFGYYDNNVQVFSVGWHAVEFSFGADGSLFAAGIMASRSQTIASGLPSLPGYPSNYSTWRYNSSAQSWDPCKMDATQIAVDPGGHALAIRENTGVLYKGSLDQTH